MEQSYAEANAKKKTTGSVIALKIILIILVILVFLASILISISTKINLFVLIGVAAIFGLIWYWPRFRVSMGTVFQVPWTYIENKNVSWPQGGMDLLHEYGFKTVAMALRNDSVRIDDEKLHAEEKLAIILGTEGDGLAAETMADCDYTVKIPMSHGVDSLNVAAASAVAFWEFGK